MGTKKEQNEVNTKPVRFYKKASFPWAIIVLSAVAMASFIGGWNMKSIDDSRVKAEAAHIVQLSK